MKSGLTLKANSSTGRKLYLGFSSALLTLALAACGGSDSGGGSGGGGTTPPVTVTPSPSPTPAPTPPPSPTPSPAPTPTSWAAGAAALYDVAPNPASCQPGILKASVRHEMLARVNAVRALHRLPPVVHSDVDNQGAADSSLMMAVNRTLNHTPPSSWTCFTNAGADAAASGNLIGGWGNGLPWSSEDALLAGWMTERNSATIGHRRWLLDPFLGQITYGRVAYQSANGDRADAATMKVFSFSSNPPAPAASSIPDYVAYPYGDYPIRYFAPGDILSFSVVANRGGRFASGNANVRFDSAVVTVSAGSTDLPVTQVANDNVGYGLPNSIQWRVTGLQRNTSYTVRIVGVTGAPQSGYEYSFRIVD